MSVTDMTDDCIALIADGLAKGDRCASIVESIELLVFSGATLSKFAAARTSGEDSGEAAHRFRHDVARHSDLMPPSWESSLAVNFVAPSVGARQSSNPIC
jgi:hypothetical protein